MRTESMNKNYERNRENRGKKRRFRGGTNFESLHEGPMKTSPGARRSRIDMPTRDAKSLNNLSQIDKANNEDPGNNGGAALLTFSRFLKFLHIPVTQSNSGKSTTFDSNSSPPLSQQSRKGEFVGPLGLGEFVDTMGGGFDELDLTNTPTHAQGKSRSLIDISMSNLWGIEEDGDDECPENGNFDEEIIEKFRRPSISDDRRPNLLATISRLVPNPPPTPNLVQFFDSPSTTANIYENMETTFFGKYEDRWPTSVFVVTTCSQMQRGDLFSVHRVSDYLAELKLTLDWAKNVVHICDGELRKYKSLGKGKRQRRLQPQGALSKSENEAEMKELHADFSAFLEAGETFLSLMGSEFRNTSVSAILIAGHSERLVSMKNILPIRIPFNLNDTQKVPPYREFLCEASASAVYSAFCRSPESPTEISAFLCTDSLLLACKCRGPKTSTSSGKYNSHHVNTLRPSGVFETLARFPLAFLGVSVTAASTTNTTSESVPIVKITPPVACSSSSGISSAASTEEEIEAGSENGSSLVVPTCEEGAGVDLWWPPGNKCHLEFLESSACNLWRASLQTTMEQIQGRFANQVLNVRVLNEIEATGKCVQKFIALTPGITGHEFKEKALTAMNIGCQLEEIEMVANVVDPIRGSLQLPLSDDDQPFLLALYMTAFSGEKATDEAIDLFAADPTDRCLAPSSLTFSLYPDRIPVTFTIRDSRSGHCRLQPRGSVLPEIGAFFTDRPKSNLFPEGSRAYKSNLRGLSQSSHNLSVMPAAPPPGGKGRSRSRLRLHFSRSNLTTAGEDNDSEEAPQQFGIFGRLPKEAWPDCRVSMSVMSLFVMVFYKGSLTEGIFRKAVLISQMQSMIQRVDTNEDPLMADECTPLCAANILKKYFSEIPGHLLIDDKWEEWCKITTLKTEEEIANYAKRMIRELPAINQSLLTFLLFTLAQVRVNQAVNKMSVNALSTVWGPNLLERPNSAPSVEDSTMCATIVACLLGPFTDAYCLRSLEFRQKLSVFFDEIWGQMVQSAGGVKPLPEGISILELPDTKSEGETTPPNAGTDNTSRLLEVPQVKEKRNLWLIHSPSEEDSSDSQHGTRRYLKTIKRDSKFSSSQESAELPPPIPPRNRRKSTSWSPQGPSPPTASNCSTSMESEVPPPLPARSLSTVQSPLLASPKEQKEKATLVTTVTDRRRSFSRRRHPSRSPVRSCTIDVGVEGHRAFMIGDNCEDYDSLSLSSPKSPLKAVKTTTALPLKRSTSDVDALLQNKLISLRKKSQNSRFFDCLGPETMRPEGVLYPWHTISALRTSSRNHRCDIGWICGLYPESNVVGKRSDPPEDLSTTVTAAAAAAVLRRDPSSYEGVAKPPGVRQRPTAVYLEGKSELQMPPIPIGSIYSRISSAYEKKNDYKNWSMQEGLLNTDRLNSLNGSTHLSRGSSHTSTGSSTSTTLGPN